MSENLNSWQLQAVQFNSWQNCCQNGLILPYGIPPNSFCCNGVIAPVSPQSPSGTVTCSGVDCSSYAPVCFSVSGKNLCSYLAGIDVAICTLQTSVANIPCSAISVGGNYTCIVGLVPTISYNLCQWTAAVNATFCAINAKVNFLGGGVPIGLVPDGNKGILNSFRGMVFLGGTGSITGSPTHGSSSGSTQIIG